MKTGFVLHIAWVRWWSALAYYALTLAEGMRALGTPVRMIVPPATPPARRAAALDLGPGGLEDLVSRRPDRLVGAVLRLRGLARSGQVAGVIVHAGPGHLASALALRGTPAPLLRARPEIRLPSSGPFARWLYTRATDRVLVPGEFLRGRTARALGMPEERIIPLPAGIASAASPRMPVEECRRRLRASAGWREEDVVVGMLARYSPVKGHEDLIEAARQLVSGRPGLRFFLAGPPGQTGRAAIEAKVREKGLAGRFAVREAVEDPLDTAAGFDLAVIPSRGSEAVCRSALEYMALGLPIVATEVNVIPETIGGTGHIVPAGSPEKLARAIAGFLAEPACARETGARARERVRERFDRDRLAARCLELLGEARGERRRHE